MERFRMAVKWPASKLNYVSGICLVAMMGINCLDIILRFFRMPFPGTYEIVGFLSAIMISFAMAQATLERTHVAVELIVSRLSKPIQKGFFVFVNIIVLILLILLSFETFRYGIYFRNSGELSLTLQFPFYPILYGMSVAYGLAVLVPAADIGSVLIGKQKAWYNWQ